jgi:hypothetical protein
MLNLVKKAENTIFTKIPPHEARSFALDYAYRKVQAINPLTVEETIQLRSVVDDFLVRNIEQFKIIPSAPPIPANPTENKDEIKIDVS